MTCRLLSVLAIVLCALAPSPLGAQAPVSPSLLDDANHGPVRVLIRLQTVAVPEGRLAGPPAVAAQRQRIASAQTRVMTTLGRATLRRFRTVPWMAAEVTSSELAQLARHPSVAAIHRDVLMKPALAQAVPFLGAPIFWQAGYRGQGWTVVVVDTGVDRHHPALTGRVIHEACFSTNYPADGATSLCAGGASSGFGTGSAPPCAAGIAGCQHGTIIAGVIGARTTQISGVAPHVNLAAIQVFSRLDGNIGQCGSTAPCARSYMSDQVAALEHVLDIAGPANQNRIAAANLSLSGDTFTSTCDTEAGMPAFKDAADNLRAIGIPTIVASGNDGLVDAIGSPACVSTVVSVAGSLGTDNVLYGNSNRASFLSLLAPGTEITSSVPGGGFGTFAGTSLSAGLVSGGWALFKQFMPNASVTTLLNAARASGATVPDSTGVDYRRIRLVPTALEANGGMPVPPGQPQNAHAVVAGNHVTFSWTPPATGNGVTRYVVSAGSQPGGADIGTFDVGVNTSIAAVVGSGSYWVRVRAENPGGPSAPTDDETFTITAPGPPSMLNSNVADHTVTLTWQAPNTGSAPTSYVVEAGSEPGLANIVVFNTGSVTPGIIVNGVPPGNYHVRVRAKNAIGLSAPSNEIIVTVE